MGVKLRQTSSIIVAKLPVRIELEELPMLADVEPDSFLLFLNSHRITLHSLDSGEGLKPHYTSSDRGF